MVFIKIIFDVVVIGLKLFVIFLVPCTCFALLWLLLQVSLFMLHRLFKIC